MSQQHPSFFHTLYFLNLIFPPPEKYYLPSSTFLLSLPLHNSISLLPFSPSSPKFSLSPSSRILFLPPPTAPSPPVFYFCSHYNSIVFATNATILLFSPLLPSPQFYCFHHHHHHYHNYIVFTTATTTTPTLLFSQPPPLPLPPPLSQPQFYCFHHHHLLLHLLLHSFIFPPPLLLHNFHFPRPPLLICILVLFISYASFTRSVR